MIEPYIFSRNEKETISELEAKKEQVKNIKCSVKVALNLSSKGDKDTKRKNKRNPIPVRKLPKKEQIKRRREYFKKYHQENKEELNRKKREYYKANKLEITRKQREIYHNFTKEKYKNMNTGDKYIFLKMYIPYNIPVTYVSDLGKEVVVPLTVIDFDFLIVKRKAKLMLRDLEDLTSTIYFKKESFIPIEKLMFLKGVDIKSLSYIELNELKNQLIEEIESSKIIYKDMVKLMSWGFDVFRMLKLKQAKRIK